MSGAGAPVPGRFAERVALVTGGGGAIGGAAALRLAAEGAAVVVADRDAAAAQRLAARVAGAGGRALAVACDVGEPAGAEAAVAAAVRAYGGLDAVFNNAGVSGAPARVQDLDVAAYDELMRVNLRGVFLVLRASLRAMIAGGRPGAIVNMSSSMAGWDVLDGGAAYAASKHGVLGLTRSAALDAAPHGIRVNAVCPGVVQTTLGVPAMSREADGAEDAATAQLRRFAARIPLRRLGQPDDVAAVTAFLASDDARHVTGAALLVDGGQTLQSWANAPDDAYPSVLAGPSDPTDPRRQPMSEITAESPLDLPTLDGTDGAITIRKWVVHVEDVLSDGARATARPIRHAVIAAVIGNPYAGRWSDDLELLENAGEQLATAFMTRALELLGGDVEAYGKGGIVGENGELEHVAALLHPRFGHPTRSLAEGISILPSVKKRGGQGTTVDIPVHHKRAMMIRSHFDSIEFRVPDAPAADEIVVALAVSDGGRPHPRVGGLRAEDAEGVDGLR